MLLLGMLMEKRGTDLKEENNSGKGRKERLDYWKLLSQFICTIECANDRYVVFFSTVCCTFHYKLCIVEHVLHNSFVLRIFFLLLSSVIFFILLEIDPNQYNYQSHYGYLQNQSLPTSENSQNPPHYVMYRPFHTNENSQNPLQYVMCPPPPLISENSQNPPQYIMYPLPHWLGIKPNYSL